MKKDRMIGALTVLCVFSVIMMMLALNRPDSGAAFTAPPFEPAAEPGVPNVPENLGYQELDVQLFRVNLCGEIQSREGAAAVWLTNPEGNNVWLKVRILDQGGSILGESGLLKPGEYVRWVEAEGILPGSPVVLKVMAYEPETYHSAGTVTFHTQIAAQ